MTRAGTSAPGDPYRYGVYLRPDPRTCAAITTITGQLRAQYGLVSAGAFPPHATLVGSQHVVAPAGEIVAALDAALAGVRAFPVHQGGVVRHGIGWVYDVHHLADGSVNTALLDLAELVDAALAPLVTEARSPEPHRFDRAAFGAHLSLASHDLYERPDLVEEVGEFARGMEVPVPDAFTGDVVALYRTRSDDWSGRWWTTLTWEHLRTWRLG